jgi:hypothetical protein
MVILTAMTPQPVAAGGACAIAKEMGNSLAIEWIAQKGITVTGAVEKAKQQLRQKGFTKKKLRDLHVQASTSIPHGFMVIIKSRYKTTRGKDRTSYGCGFSHRSSAEAGQVALKNLSSYSWGWKPDLGYELHARHQF